MGVPFMISEVKLQISVKPKLHMMMMPRTHQCTKKFHLNFETGG